jgi:hypothetical protein
MREAWPTANLAPARPPMASLNEAPELGAAEFRHPDHPLGAEKHGFVSGRSRRPQHSSHD